MYYLFVKAFRYITLFLMCKSVILGGVPFAPSHLTAQSVPECCCLTQSVSASSIEKRRSAAESVPCQTSHHSDYSCSEQCQKCSSAFSKILLFSEQQTLNLDIQQSFSFRWLSEKGSSLTHSPEAPPPKV